MSDATAAAQTPGPGHNEPPLGVDEQSQIIRARIEDTYKWEIARQKELLEAVPRVPETIDESTVGQASDFIKQLTQAAKALNGARSTEKEPHLAAGRTIDGLFKKLIDPLKDAKALVQARVDKHNKAKEAERRRQLEEEAERQRQERLRLEREAREAEERRRREEEERQREAQRQERERLAEIERKEKERLAEIQAEKDARIARAKARLEAGKIDETRYRELLDQITARTEKVTAESEEQLDRAFERAEAASEREAERLAVEARKAEREAKRDEKGLERAKAEETKAVKKSEVKAADLGRSRGDYGGLSTLQTKWDFRVVSWEELDLEALRPFIPREGLEQAIRGYIKVGNRKLAGAEIYEDLVGQTR